MAAKILTEVDVTSSFDSYFVNDNGKVRQINKSDIVLPIDSTLSISGKAADAKITGDAVSELKNETSELKTDIVDIENKLYQTLYQEESLPKILTDTSTIKFVNGNGVEIWNISNMFNKDKWTPNKIYNDAGEIINDGSSGYVDEYIPIIPNGLLYSSVSGQRIYYFDKDKNFLFRSNGLASGMNELSSDERVAYAIIQYSVSVVEPLLDSAVVTLLIDRIEPFPTVYTPFSLEMSASEPFNGYKNLIRSNDGIATFAMIISENEYVGRNSKLFTDINIWEPSEVDDGYSNPSSGWGQDTRREDWTADNKYLYYDFLEHYFDCYLGIGTDGYKVTKRSLGQDGANTGHELFEYDFCPVNYKYTVMLSAGMNADETQGIWGLATFMRCVMNREEPNLSIMRDNIRFKIIPIINASGFDEDLLRYKYSDGTNPNKNFNYKNSWSNQSAADKGDYPDSNITTQILKKWINDNNGADLWIDLHTGKFGDTLKKTVLDVRVADDTMKDPFNNVYKSLFKSFYVNKGFLESADYVGEASSMRSNLDYQKIVYAFDVCGIKSIMPEMHIESTGYGADGFTNNSTYGIKGYVAQIRAMVMCYINESTKDIYLLDDSRSSRFHNRY